MPTRLHLDFLDEPTVTRASEAVVRRLSTLGDIAQRSTRDVLDFAEEAARQHALKIEAAARLGEPDDTEFRAAVAGDATRFNARLATMLTRASACQEQANKDDEEAGDRLREVQQGATSLVRAEVGQRGQTGALAVLAGLFASAVAPPRPVPPPPDDLQSALILAAVSLVYARAGQELSERIVARVEERRAELRRHARSIANLQRALKTVARTTTTEREALGTLPFDLRLGGPEFVRRLFRTTLPLDWSEVVLAHGDLDEATALLLVEKTLADRVKEFQRPFPELLPVLLGGRSVEPALDTFVRNAAPLAPLRPKEAPDGFTGDSIGVVEARDEGLAAVLEAALRRAGTLKVKTVRNPDLPGEDVQARVIRFRGLLPSEALVSVVLDLYERMGPGDVGSGASRDWEGDLPALVSDVRLRREIQARKMRGAPTKNLERWLPKPVLAPDSGALPPMAEAK